MVAISFDDWLDWIYNMTYLALKVLPDSPFQELIFSLHYDFPGIGNVMSSINYFVPVGDIFTITVFYVAACATYISVRFVLRSTRFIS